MQKRHIIQLLQSARAGGAGPGAPGPGAVEWILNSAFHRAVWPAIVRAKPIAPTAAASATMRVDWPKQTPISPIYQLFTKLNARAAEVQECMTTGQNFHAAAAKLCNLCQIGWSGRATHSPHRDGRAALALKAAVFAGMAKVDSERRVKAAGQD